MSAGRTYPIPFASIQIEASGAHSSDLIGLVAALDEFLNQICGVERNHGSPIERLAHDDTRMFVAKVAGRAVAVRAFRYSKMAAEK